MSRNIKNKKGCHGYKIKLQLINAIHVNALNNFLSETNFKLNQSTYDYVKLYIGYFSNRFPVWEGIFTLNFFATCTSGTWAPDNI